MVYNTRNVRAKAAKDAKPPVKKAAPKKAAPLKTTKKTPAPRKSRAKPGAKRGGVRKGSGRKVGQATTRTREIADKLMSSDEQSPLEFLLEIMRTTPEKLQAKHKAGDLDTEQYLVALGDLQRRRESAASQAAPFCHPRLSSIEASVGLKGHDRFVDLLEGMDG
jgi:hypothetical protein